MLIAVAWIFFNAGDITRQDVGERSEYTTTESIRARLNQVRNELRRLKKEPEEYKDLSNVWTLFNRTDDSLNSELRLINRQLSLEVDQKIADQTISALRGEVDINQTLGLEVKEFHQLIGGDPIYFNSELMMNFNNYLYGRDLIKIDSNRQKIEAIHYEFLKGVDSLFSLKTISDSIEIKYQNGLDTVRISQLETERKKLESGYTIVEERELSTEFGGAKPEAKGLGPDIGVNFLIQTNITRFGPIFLALFFVGILVNLYRYNIRLSGYYDARADVLELLELGIDPDVFEKLASSLSPQQYDFGKNPQTVIDQAVDLTKTLVNKASNKTN